jgi:hypothetical protein
MGCMITRHFNACRHWQYSYCDILFRCKNPLLQGLFMLSPVKFTLFFVIVHVWIFIYIGLILDEIENIMSSLPLLSPMHDNAARNSTIYTDGLVKYFLVIKASTASSLCFLSCIEFISCTVYCILFHNYVTQKCTYLPTSQGYYKYVFSVYFITTTHDYASLEFFPNFDN